MKIGGLFKSATAWSRDWFGGRVMAVPIATDLISVTSILKCEKVHMHLHS